MSMSIPFFFEPVVHKKSYFVDGGILSNFPVWLFDSPGIPEWPTFGFKFIEPEYNRPQYGEHAPSAGQSHSLEP